MLSPSQERFGLAQDSTTSHSADFAGPGRCARASAATRAPACRTANRPSTLSQSSLRPGHAPVPLLILTDPQGIVRVLQPVSDDAILPGGTIDSAIALVGSQWHTRVVTPPAPPRPSP
jgi:hypothetical protein